MNSIFSERLQAIITELETDEKALCREIECNVSNLRRILNGGRIPKRNGSAEKRISEGIVRYAIKTGKVDKLAGIMSLSKNLGISDEKDMSRSVAAYLSGDDPTVAVNDNDSDTPYRSFGEKLSRCMDIAELSNVRLGHFLNVDASYISRFRRGQRSPRSNPSAMEKIVEIIITRAKSMGSTELLCNLIGVDESISAEDELFRSLYNWLYGKDNRTEKGVDKLIGSIDSFTFSGNSDIAFSDGDILSDEPGYIYTGFGGLRTATEIFLKQVIRKKAGTLYLYSDQDMKWFTENAEFLASWSRLMAECVKQGTKVIIIHNIDRDMTEMLDAIYSWLPLYMYGGITSYYCNKNISGSFSNTLFLCPDTACINGSNLRGTEYDLGIYRYDTDETVLRILLKRFEKLLSDSRQLVRVYSNEHLQYISGERDRIIIGSSPSLSTMPYHVLESILERNKTSDDIRHDIITAWKRQCDEFIGSKTVSRIKEICYADINSGTVRCDIPYSEYFYTYDELKEHLDNIRRLCTQNSSYDFVGIPAYSFTNVRILISDSVRVIRTTAPFITFEIYHPAMVNAFRTFANKLEAKVKVEK